MHYRDRVLVLLFAAGEAVEGDVHHRGREQGDQLGKEQAAHDGDAQRLAELRPRPVAQR